MALRNYFIRCSNTDCPREAAFKIASSWSDGVTGELKTYFLCCETCLADCFREACRKQAACRLAADETLAEPGIYRIQRRAHDYELSRLPEREAALRAMVGNNAPES